MIKVLLLDADDVLIHQERFSVVLDRDFGISLEATKEFFTGPFQDCLEGKADLKDAVTPYLTIWGCTKGVDAFLDLWFQREYNLNHELFDYIKQLQQRGIHCFLATNQEKYRVAYILEKMGLNSIFDRAFASSNLGYKKPSPEFFAVIFKNLENVKKEEILFWDDKKENIEAAKSFGIHAELYVSPADFIEKMDKYIA